MRVNPNSEPLGVTGIPTRPPAQAVGLGQDQLALGAAERLNRALGQTPATRPDEVARAKTLVEDVSYPSTDIVHAISVLLAMNVGVLNQPQ